MSDGNTEVQDALRAVTSPERAVQATRFFKSGEGQYAEGDKFLGNSVPQVRAIVKRFKDLPFAEVDNLMISQWHEERLAALLMLVARFKAGSEADKKFIYDYYVAHTKYINNWDLVDSSAEFIVGPYLEDRPEKMEVLKRLADSSLLWERRIAMLATFDYIKKGRADEALIIIEKLLNDTHDLIQKATGWMLREIGKRVDRDVLIAFLDGHAATMPRTTLRYAIEHFAPEVRQKYLSARKQ
jgi:3-methyladenine DNA glycosylase AlkD